MLMLAQNQSKAPSKPAHSKKTTSVRTETLKAIHATWKKVVRGIDVNDKDELRNSRMAFANKVLKLDPPIESFGDNRMTPRRLGQVLDEMRRLEREPGLPGVKFGVPTLVGRSPEGGTPNEAEIHHLATRAQVETIDKLIRHLGWSAIGAQEFLAKRFRRASPRLLTPAQANSCTMILFNIAATRRIKARFAEAGKGDQKVSRALIRAEIPALKRDLGIDQKPSADFADYTDEEKD